MLYRTFEDRNDAATRTRVRILTKDCFKQYLGTWFIKKTGDPSFELIKTKSDPIYEQGNICVSLELLPLRKKCFRTEKINI